MSTALCTAEVEITIPFHDVDLMGVAWHGHYLKYFELARGALLDRIGYNYREMGESGYSWPVIEAYLRYPGRTEYGQRVRVQATLDEWENRLRINYLITDVESGKRLTTGHTVQVAVHMASGEMQFASPAILLEKVTSHL